MQNGVDPLTVIWTFVSLLAMFAVLLCLIDAWEDLRAINKKAPVNGRKTIAKTEMRHQLLRLVPCAFMFIVGFIYFGTMVTWWTYVDYPVLRHVVRVLLLCVPLFIMANALWDRRDKLELLRRRE